MYNKKKYPRTQREFEKVHGSNGIQKAKAILKARGTAETGRLLLHPDFGNDFQVASQIIEAGKVADAAVHDRTNPPDSGFYDSNLSAKREVAKLAEGDANDEFNKTIHVEIKQSFIERSGPLDSVT
jgi:hypothetical protein